MTEFLESFATQQLLPPWQAKGVDVSCFMFELPKKSIQMYLDQFFNFGGADRAPYYFMAHPDLQHGMLVFHHYADIWSANVANMRRYGEDLQSWDHVSYNQMYVAVPIVRYALTKDNLLDDPQVYWIQPVVICDNSSVVYGSREIVGIDMIQGEVKISRKAPSGALHIDTLLNGVEKFAPRSKEKLLPFVHVETGAPLTEGMPPASTKAAASFLMGLANVTNRSASAPGTPLPEVAKLVTLKQFRDSYDMTRATYQAIISSNSIMTNVTDLHFYDPATVDIDFMWSATVGEILTSFLDLGTFTPAAATKSQMQPHAEPGWDLPHKKLNPEVCFGFSADFSYTEFETLHTFGQKG